MVRARVTALSIAIAGDAPPSEFRIFAAGANETVKGTFVFDEAAAKSVMAEYEAHGIDLPLDYDHAMLGTDRSVDPALSGKAAGWFELEVRNGELWAVNVRWTPPAAEALQRKEWRFMSPAFQADESGRVMSLLNVAITNLPATRRLEPLMAASVTALGVSSMDPALTKKALDVVAAGDAEAALALLKDVLAAAASGDPDATTEDAPPPMCDGGADETTEAAATTEPAKEEDKQAVAASISWLTRATGKTSLSASIEEVKVWKASHLKLEAEEQRLAKDRAALEADERRRLYAELVTAGRRAPSTVWADEKAKKPKSYLASMTIAELREHVSEAKSAAPKGAPKSPVGGVEHGEDGSKSFETPDGVTTLTANQLRECERVGVKPETFAAHQARRLKANKR